MYLHWASSLVKWALLADRQLVSELAQCYDSPAL